MCEIDMDEEFKLVPVMLSGDAWCYYSYNLSSCTDFNQAMQMFRNWYNSDERKDRTHAK